MAVINLGLLAARLCSHVSVIDLSGCSGLGGSCSELASQVRVYIDILAEVHLSCVLQDLALFFLLHRRKVLHLCVAAGLLRLLDPVDSLLIKEKAMTSRGQSVAMATRLRLTTCDGAHEWLPHRRGELREVPSIGLLLGNPDDLTKLAVTAKIGLGLVSVSQDTLDADRLV